MRPSNNERFPTSDNYNNLTRKEHRALLYLNSSNQMVVAWLHNSSPSGASWLRKSVALVPYSGGAPDRVPDLAVSPVSISSRASFFLRFSVLFIFHTALPLLRARFIKSVAPRPRNASFAPVCSKGDLRSMIKGHVCGIRHYLPSSKGHLCSFLKEFE